MVSMELLSELSEEDKARIVEDAIRQLTHSPEKHDQGSVARKDPQVAKVPTSRRNLGLKRHGTSTSSYPCSLSIPEGFQSQGCQSYEARVSSLHDDHPEAQLGQAGTASFQPLVLNSEPSDRPVMKSRHNSSQHNRGHDMNSKERMNHSHTVKVKQHRSAECLGSQGIRQPIANDHEKESIEPMMFNGRRSSSTIHRSRTSRGEGPEAQERDGKPIIPLVVRTSARFVSRRPAPGILPVRTHDQFTAKVRQLMDEKAQKNGGTQTQQEWPLNKLSNQDLEERQKEDGVAIQGKVIGTREEKTYAVNNEESRHRRGKVAIEPHGIHEGEDRDRKTQEGEDQKKRSESPLVLEASKDKNKRGGRGKRDKRGHRTKEEAKAVTKGNVGGEGGSGDKLVVSEVFVGNKRKREDHDEEVASNTFELPKSNESCGMDLMELEALTDRLVHDLRQKRCRYSGHGYVKTQPIGHVPTYHDLSWRYSSLTS